MDFILCACCGEEKSPTEFASSSAKKNGKQSYCRPCATERRKQSPYKYNAVADRKRQMKYKYGLSAEAFEQLWTLQEGKCAICAIELARNNRGVSIDHNHVTKEVRGLLCNKCNTGLGLLKDSIDVVKSALTYLTERGSYGPKAA